jgi:hypothetical protein
MNDKRKAHITVKRDGTIKVCNGQGDLVEIQEYFLAA